MNKRELLTKKENLLFQLFLVETDLIQIDKQKLQKGEVKHSE